jgi:hypothetical protein
MAAHQIYYWNDDTREWLKSMDRATPYPSESAAQRAKDRCPSASGVEKDKDDHWHYVMRVGLEATDA